MQRSALATPTGTLFGGLPQAGAAAALPAAPAEIHSAAGRIVVLDGLRGLMTVFVVLSHFFGEVPTGINALAVGWLAVLMFFVLSGFLVGRLILEKQHHANFFFVFYVRRCCRTLPVYVFCVLFVYAMMLAVGRAPYMDITAVFPLWSYLTFTQNFFMVDANAFGPYWLAPTWTLSVEEQFYLIAPALFLFVPRRFLVTVLTAGALIAVLFRAAILWGGWWPALAASVFLPGCMDPLFCGLLAAVLYKSVDLTRYDQHLRVLPLVMLAAVLGLRLVDRPDFPVFDVFSRLFASIGCAAYIVAVVRGSPEGERLKSPVLCFFGQTSYAVYLTHLAVLGLMHGLVLGTLPDIATPVQWAITLAALPATVLLGWGVTKLVEEPITAYGRSFAWSKEARG